MKKYTLAELATVTNKTKPFLLNKVGFETRSISSVVHDQNRSWRGIYTMASKDRSGRAQTNLQRLRDFVANDGIPFEFVGELDEHDSLDVQESISSIVRQVIESSSRHPLWIDFTALRREELLILVRTLVASCSHDTLNRVSGLYVSARKMGEWLSSDVTDVRSVVGYPGSISPSKKTTLILMMGFEIARARSIIEAYEPSRIILGFSNKGGSINSELFERNQDVLRRVTSDFLPLTAGSFEFSATDPISCAKSLERIILDENDQNVVLAPLHTKISALGAAAVGLRYPSVQVCYAAVEEYNEILYSEPGDEVFLIPFSDLFIENRGLTDA